MRNTILLDNDWQFVKTAASASAAWEATGEAVTLPHTWNAIDGQDGGNDYYRGLCWYRRKLDITEVADGQSLEELKKEKEIWMEFCGAAMTAEFYLNGEKRITHEGGYSTFRVNLTEYLQEENQLTVSVDNSDNDRVYPQKADFTFYGGLYREVNLLIVPKAHFALGYSGGSGIKVTPEVVGKDAKVTAEAWVEGVAKTVTFVIGNLVQEAQIIDGHAEAVFTIENVHLWDGIDDPYLYTIKADICQIDEDGDSITTKFGCRTIKFDSQEGFFLNGRRYPLRGVSRHQDRLGTGNVLTNEMQVEDLEIIREIGANTIRLAHYQHSQYFYDLCDACGMILWAEIPYITQHMTNGRVNTLSQMRELVVQNYNHPSIICWGLSNEISASGGVTDDLMENHRLLNDLCHSLDATRPTTMAHVFMLETDSPLLEIPDIASYNLYFGWYLGELERNNSFFDEYHATYPKRCIGFSEYGADANPAFHSSDPECGDYTEEYQCVYHEHIIRMIEERPYLWATHVWNMFDFAADGRDEGGKNGKNQKGLVTMDRKLKKDAFYLYKAYWSEEAFVHLCGSRYVDRAEAVTEVKVYSNQPEVTLYVDGELIETQKRNRVFCFAVPIGGIHTVQALAGQCTDAMSIRKVEKPNQDYRFGTAGDIVNWFDKDDFKEGYFSIKDTLATLQSHPQTGAIMGAMMAQTSAGRGDVAESVKDNPNLIKMMGAMTLESMLKQVGDVVSQEQVKALNAALQQIPKQ